MRNVTEKAAMLHKRRKRRTGVVRLRQSLAAKVAKGVYAERKLRGTAAMPVDGDLVRLSDEQISRIKAVCDAPPPITEHLRHALASPPWKLGS